MEALEWIGFIAIIVVYAIFVTRQKWWRDELASNEVQDTHSDQQIKWHITHMRDDMHMLVVTNFAVLIVLLAILFLKN